MDHLVTQANGGHQTHGNNLVPACRDCNVDKSTRSSRTHRLAIAADREAHDSRRQDPDRHFKNAERTGHALRRLLRRAR
ncbi:MAG: HNH endonuclease [Elusimicrobia bacterium]|nr:HNH endonuclease [Elusimicrobiota bacterium]